MSWITDNQFEFRPLPEESKGLLRYANGTWIDDDGEWDMAFISGKEYVEFPYTICLEMPNPANLLWSYVHHGNWRTHIAEHPNGKAWHYMTTNGKIYSGTWKQNKHINEIVHDIATSKCLELHGCANGHGPEFRILDPYIKAGLVRIKGTEEIVKFPKIFKCCFCGDIDWQEAEKLSADEMYKRRRIKTLEAELRSLKGGEQ